MGRQKTARRFDPFYPVTAAVLEVEVEHVRRESEKYALLAPADVEKFRVERHANLETTWRHLNLILEAMPERDQRIVQSLMFRDLWYVLELYKTHLQPICLEIAPTATPPIKAKRAPLAFSEFLFDLSAGKK